MNRLLLICTLLISTSFVSVAATIQGEIRDFSSSEKLAEVFIKNVHTGATTYSGDSGTFLISGISGELLEFRKVGYQTLRVRLPEGAIPRYFQLVMHREFEPLENFARGGSGRWLEDSLYYAELYGRVLDFPRLEGFDAIRHPFSALSKRNRQMWAFQDEFSEWQKQKYVDYQFSEKLISNLTGLRGDSLNRYMVQFRPTYEQLRRMSAYEYYTYISRTVYTFRTGIVIYPHSIRRSSQ